MLWVSKLIIFSSSTVALSEIMNQWVKLHQSANFNLQIFKGIVQGDRRMAHNYKSIDLPSSLKFHQNLPRHQSVKGLDLWRGSLLRCLNEIQNVSKNLKWDYFDSFLLCALLNPASYAAPQIPLHVSEDAGIEPRTVATLALTSRRFNHSARSHPPKTVSKVKRSDPVAG